jgi:predicted CoA-binding protein
MMSNTVTVAVVGASNNPQRIAYEALGRLLQKNYAVIPVNPKGGEILGQKVVRSISAIDAPVDTVTMYVNAQRQTELLEEIITLQPRRIIFNPGSENPEAYPRLRKAGIAVQEACTLVLLSTRQFDLPV